MDKSLTIQILNKLIENILSNDGRDSTSSNLLKHIILASKKLGYSFIPVEFTYIFIDDQEFLNRNDIKRYNDLFWKSKKESRNLGHFYYYKKYLRKKMKAYYLQKHYGRLILSEYKKYKSNTFSHFIYKNDNVIIYYLTWYNHVDNIVIE